MTGWYWCRAKPATHALSRNLAGYDLPPYDGTEESLIRLVMQWLLIHPEALPGVRPTQVIKRLELFRKEKASLKAEWGQISWKLLVDAAVKVVDTPVDKAV